MAILDLNVWSGCLQRNVQCKVILPNDIIEADSEYYKRAPKMLMLLHGYCCNMDEWVWNSAIVPMAKKYNLCVVLPNGENSFFLDGKETGRKYATYVGEELPAYIQKTFGLSKDPADNYVAGFSMGGFGAIHTGLQFPMNYGKVAALSSALLMYELANLKPGETTDVANYDYYALMFGETQKLEQSENNPEVLVKKLKESGESIPDFYMACGSEDFLIEPNRRFHSFLESENVTCTYKESPGVHDFVFWNQYLEPAIRWLLGL